MIRLVGAILGGALLVAGALALGYLIWDMVADEMGWRRP